MMRAYKRISRRSPARNRRNQAGETLSETLVAMLIVGLSSVLFLTMVLTSARIFEMARDKYEESYGVISDAEEQSNLLDNSDSLGEITVKGSDSTTGVTVNVNWYGNKDYVLSYKVS